MSSVRRPISKYPSSQIRTVKPYTLTLHHGQASAVASEVAGAAQEQASRAAAAAAARAAEVRGTDAFAFASTAFAEIRANTIAAAESAEGNIRTFYQNDDELRTNQGLKEVNSKPFKH